MPRSISEEFKDQKIHDLLEDYIALEKQIDKTANQIITAINETPSRLDAVVSGKLNTLIENLEEEIEKSKNDIKQISNECQSDITKHITNTFAGVKKNFDQIAAEHKNQLTELAKINTAIDFDSIKKNLAEITNTHKEQLAEAAKAAKPFSFTKAIAICALCTVFVSAAISGTVWYHVQHEKEESLHFYASAFLDMKKITEESMRKLPKSDQQNIKLKLDEIDSRKP